MDVNDRVTNGRGGREEATVCECEGYKGRGSLHSHIIPLAAVQQQVEREKRPLSI